MADETLPGGTPEISEVIPGRVGELSHNNVVAITLEAARLMTVGGKLVTDRAVVGHLRMSLETMRVLKATLDEIELLAKPPASGEKN